jgi:hypothetical protein
MYFYFFLGWFVWMMIAFNLFLASCFINGRLPRSLIGRGEIDAVLTVDGRTANTVRISIR